MTKQFEDLERRRAAVQTDFEVVAKVIRQTLKATGYKFAGKPFLEVSRGFDCAWIVELRFEVER